MLYRRFWLPAGFAVASLFAGCGSAETGAGAEPASPTPALPTTALPTTALPTTLPTTALPTTALPTETVAASPTEAATADGVATATPVGAAPTATAGDQSTPLMEELDPVESVQGGNVNQVYLGDAYPPELAGIVTRMIDDAAERSGLAAAEIDVVAVADVTWSDTSLGCGRPGFSYAQVLTDGMRVVLEVDDLFYDYRAGGVDAFFLCSRGEALDLTGADSAAPDPAAPDPADGDKSSPGLYEITEDGVVQVEPPTFDDRAPTEGTNPPDE